MEVFKLPTRKVSVRITMDSGQAFDGVMYAVAEGPDGKPGRLADRLNDVHEEFLPVARGDDLVLLNTSGIVKVQMLESGFGEVPDFEDQPAKLKGVRITIADGTSLVGRFFVSMPVGRERVVDFLNAAPRFLPLLGDDHVTLVQRGYIHAVRYLEQE